LSAITEVNKEYYPARPAYSTIKVYASGGIVLNRIPICKFGIQMESPIMGTSHPRK
jgi:hypothetical protein